MLSSISPIYYSQDTIRSIGQKEVKIYKNLIDYVALVVVVFLQSNIRLLTPTDLTLIKYTSDHC